MDNRNAAAAWSSGKPPRVANIIAAAAGRCNTTPRMVLSGSREAPVMRAKRMVIRDLRDLGLSLATIGRYLGGMHHTSILHHLREESRRQAVSGDYDPEAPDFSGEWAI